MVTEFAPVDTPASPARVYVALGKAWSPSGIALAPAAPLRLLLAQWALETGRGKSCKCWNLGNVKSSEGDGHDFTFFGCGEILSLARAHAIVAERPATARITWSDAKDAEVAFVPRDPVARFRAFATLEAGAVDWLDLQRRQFATAWQALLTGDPAAFAHALKAQGYYTADEAQYTRGLVSLFEEFSHLQLDGQHFDLSTMSGVQGALAALGYYTGKIDGMQGPMTTAAVKAFQTDAVIERDGVVGKDTRRELAKALAAKAS